MSSFTPNPHASRNPKLLLLLARNERDSCISGLSLDSGQLAASKSCVRVYVCVGVDGVCMCVQVCVWVCVCFNCCWYWCLGLHTTCVLHWLIEFNDAVPCCSKPSRGTLFLRKYNPYDPGGSLIPLFKAIGFSPLSDWEINFATQRPYTNTPP